MRVPREIQEVMSAILHSRLGVVGLAILITLVILSIIALIHVPFDVAREWNNPQFWRYNPRLALPEWVNLFTGEKLPETFIVSNESISKKYSYYLETAGLNYIILEMKFSYNYKDFPSELRLLLYVNANRALVEVVWVKPDNREMPLLRDIFQRGLSDKPIPETTCRALFLDQNSSQTSPSPINGVYTLKITAITSDDADDVNAELIVYGKVYGLAGTDDRRRDLFVGIVWGAPIALSFGLIAAFATSFIQTIIGALSAWYGGALDELIQRITDIYMILPFLPILIMISIIYRINIWTLLVVVVGLSIFGGATKTARSMTFQIMAEQYIEAAISYGASRSRILFLYILPKLLPYTIANMVLSVPSYVFLEAALSVLGLGDPMMPTWGKIISDAFSGGAVTHGLWWWVLLPSALITLTAISFAFIGLALDKVVNPRLRER